MVLNGRHEVAFANDFYFGYDWSATQNVAGNKSTVTVTTYIRSTQSWAYTVGANSQNTNTITINGNKKTFTATSQINAWQKKTLGSHKVDVPHNGDGTKTFNINASHYWSVYYNVYGPMTVSASKDWTLNQIPRASKISVNKTSAEYGTNVVINITPAGAGLTHNIRANWNGVIQTIANKAENSTNWTVPLDYMNRIPNATATWGTIYCDTYSGSTKIGETTTRLDTTVPSNIIPSYTSQAVVDTNSKVNSVVGTDKYIQGLSVLRFTIAGAKSQYSSTIKTYGVTVGGTEYTSSEATIDIPTASFKNSTTFSVYVLDSRNRKSAVQNRVLNFMTYSAPSITLTADRTEKGTGTNLTFTRNTEISTLEGANQHTTSLSWKVLDSTTYLKTNQLPKTSKNIKDTFSDTTTTSEFLGNVSYQIEAIIEDRFNKFTVSTIVSSATATLALGATGIGVGKMHQQGAMDIKGEVFIDGSIDLTGDSYKIDGLSLLKRIDANDIEIGALGRDIVLGNDKTRFVNIVKPTDVRDLMDFWQRLRIRGGGSIIFNGAGDNGQGITMNDYGNMKFSSSNSGNQWSMKTGGNGDVLVLQNVGTKPTSAVAPTDALRICSDAVGPYMACARVWDRTYSQAPNVYITNYGTFGRSTSASKYKLDISSIPNYQYRNILNLEAKTWFDKTATEKQAEYMTKKLKIENERKNRNISNGEKNYKIEELKEDYQDIPPLERIFGLIAEDVYESGLKEYVTYSINPETGEKEIEGIQYDRLVVPLIELAKEHDKRIQDLENQILELSK